jgi:hypothetical protein
LVASAAHRPEAGASRLVTLDPELKVEYRMFLSCKVVDMGKLVIVPSRLIV